MIRFGIGLIDKRAISSFLRVFPRIAYEVTRRRSISNFCFFKFATKKVEMSCPVYFFSETKISGDFPHGSFG